MRAKVRTAASFDKALVADVKANGIIEPIVAYRDGGEVAVMAGHRRTLAAVEAGLCEVPVFLRDQPDEADRITMQVSENQRREALSERDEAAALFELTQRVSEAQVAKRMHVDRAHAAKVKDVFTNETAANYLNPPDGEPAADEDANAVYLFTIYTGEVKARPVRGQPARGGHRHRSRW